MSHPLLAGASTAASAIAVVQTREDTAVHAECGPVMQHVSTPVLEEKNSERRCRVCVVSSLAIHH